MEGRRPYAKFHRDASAVPALGMGNDEPGEEPDDGCTQQQRRFVSTAYPATVQALRATRWCAQICCRFRRVWVAVQRCIGVLRVAGLVFRSWR